MIITIEYHKKVNAKKAVVEVSASIKATITDSERAAGIPERLFADYGKDVVLLGPIPREARGESVWRTRALSFEGSLDHCRRWMSELAAELQCQYERFWELYDSVEIPAPAEYEVTRSSSTEEEEEEA